MYWPKFSEKAFWRKIEKSRRPPSGVSACYLQWTKYVGLKMFFDGSCMKAAYRRQKKASKYGLAPKVGKKIKIKVISFGRSDTTWSECDAPIPVKQTLYCYFTETATKVGRIVAPAKRIKLYNALEDVGIVNDDLHRGNMGYVGKKLVCIDFDDASCY